MAGKLSTYDVVVQAPAAIPASILADQAFQYLKSGKWPEVKSAAAFEYLAVKAPEANAAWMQNFIAWASALPLWLTTLGIALLWAIAFSALVKRPGSPS